MLHVKHSDELQVRTELKALAARYGLTAHAGDRLLKLQRAIAQEAWLPTKITEPLDVLRFHIADSIASLPIEGLAKAHRVVDIGSGAGFPGLALAAALPDTQFVLLEAIGRKAHVAELIAESADLANVSVHAVRAEEWAVADGRGRYDVAVCRAVASLATVVEYAAPLLRIGGLAIVWKGRRDAEEERRAVVACEELGVDPVEVIAVGPFAGSKHRHLHLYKKVKATPAKFPRRAGVAKKRPLGGQGTNVRQRTVS